MGIQRYGILSEYGGNGDGDAKFWKKYQPEISWGERVFYRRNSSATKVYEVANYPQELQEYDTVNGVIKTNDPHRYVDIYDGFLMFNNNIYRFGTYETQIVDGTLQDIFVPSDTMTIDTITDINALDHNASNVFKAQKSSIWHWKGNKYVYMVDFDCVNTTPITTSTNEPIAGAIMKTQSVVLKTQFFNDFDDSYAPTRFDIIEWRGDLYIVDEQDKIPHYRPALVNDYIISISKLL